MALLNHSIYRYLLVGIANTLVGLTTIYICKFAFAFGDVSANATGYATGLALSFLLNRSWTFQHDGNITPSFLRYITVLAFAYAVNLSTVMLLIQAGMNSYLAQAAGVPPYTLIGYLGSRYFAFTKAA